MNDEIKINKSNKSITFINDGIAFSQFGIADEILNLITNLQKENEKLKNRIEEITKIYQNESKYRTDLETKHVQLQQEIQKKNAYIKYLEEYNPKYYKGEKFYGIEGDDENEK